MVNRDRVSLIFMDWWLSLLCNFTPWMNLNSMYLPLRLRHVWS